MLCRILVLYIYFLIYWYFLISINQHKVYRQHHVWNKSNINVETKHIYIYMYIYTDIYQYKHQDCYWILKRCLNNKLFAPLNDEYIYFFIKCNKITRISKWSNCHINTWSYEEKIVNYFKYILCSLILNYIIYV